MVNSKKFYSGTLEWRNWQTHGTQKPKHTVNAGQNSCPYAQLGDAGLGQDNALFPENRYCLRDSSFF